MPSERVQRRIDRLLDEGEQAMDQHDWALVQSLAREVLSLDPENADGTTFLASAERMLAPIPGLPVQPSDAPTSRDSGATDDREKAPTPTSFVNGRYEVEKFLGEGGKKKVYLARDTVLRRRVAYALIKTEGLDDVGRERIVREGQAMGTLGAHPHIVTVFDLGEEQGAPYMVTELMEGGDVEGVIEKAQEHKLPLEQALRIADEVCQGLEFAHSKGIVHRDLKPGNVWLTADDTVKIGDFGLAVSLDRSRLTQAGMMVGTVSYMPPEQATGSGVTARSDLYSLGSMLYEMVTGHPPFLGDDTVAIIGQHLNVAPIAPAWYRPDCPPGLEALILRLLEKDPSKRPASAAEVRQALTSLTSALHSQPSSSAARTSDVPTTEGESPAGGLDNPLYRRVFVGREQETRQLQTALDASLSGQGGLVMVVGEPGIGKTALVEQLATYATLRGAKTLWGHCYEEGSLSLPYLAFVEALRSYVLERPVEALRQELGTAASDLARIVSEVRERLDIAPRPPSEPEEDRWRLLQAVSGFLRNASSMQPLVVVLEDLHWADQGTLDLLVHIARNFQGVRLLVVGTYRDVEVDRAHSLSAALGDLRRSGSFARVQLRGLGTPEVQRMLQAITGSQVPGSLAEAIHRQTEGNPLFVQEVVRFLVEEGHLGKGGASAAAVGMSIPEGLRDVIGRRLSRLSPECNRVLAIAAVIGRDFGLDTLQAVSDLDEEAVVSALEEALRVGVLEEQSRPGVIRYRFAHAFFRQTLYEELIAPRRLRLHQQVAAALERQYANRLEEHAAELAEHFAQSTDREDLAKAVRYGELAAQRAMAVYAYGEAVRHLEQALAVQEVLDPLDRAKRCDLLLTLGEALGPAGESQRAFDTVAPEAFSLAEQMHDANRASRACVTALLSLSRFSPSQGESVSERAAWVERATRYAEPGTPERSYADSALAVTRYNDRDFRGAHEALVSARTTAEALGNQEAYLFSSRALLARRFAPKYEREKLDLAQEIVGRPRGAVGGRDVGGSLFHAGVVLMDWGEREAAMGLWRELSGTASQTQDANVVFYDLTAQMLTAWVDGDVEQAADLAAGLPRRAEELGVRGFGAYARTYGMNALLAAGRYRTLLPLYEKGGQGDADPARVALTLASQGRFDEAEPLVTEIVSREGVGAVDGETPTLLLLVLLEATVALRRSPDVKMLAVWLTAADEVPAFPGLTCLPRHLGAASALLKDREQARAYYEQALEVCSRLRFRPELALTHLGIAELLLEDIDQTKHAEALVHLDFAIAEFRDMKMQPALERALRHKEVLKA
jgi:serine/threonine protein kinase/tetratricopeptide (TPR) repeat protein